MASSSSGEIHQYRRQPPITETGRVIIIPAKRASKQKSIKFKINNNNNVLHLAVISSNIDKINSLLSKPECKDLIKQKNDNGDLAFHCAAKGKQLEVMKALTNWENYNGLNERNDMENMKMLLKERNEQGDTPLHIALKGKMEDMARYLIDQCGVASCVLNEDNISPLYLAIEAGYRDLVNRIVLFTKRVAPVSTEVVDSWEYQLLQGKSVVHAAIRVNNLDAMKIILENYPQLIKSLDEEGRRPLSYASFQGYLDGVQYLLEKFPTCVFERDKDDDDSFPIHSAIKGGNIMVIKELSSTFRYLNGRRQNILHMAASQGKHKLVSYLVEMPGLEHLIKQIDVDGNTPSMLASNKSHDEAANMLKQLEQEFDDIDELKVHKAQQHDDTNFEAPQRSNIMVPIPGELLKLLMNGDRDKILSLETKLWELKCEEDNESVLHIAARAGQNHLIKDILPKCKDIIKWKNSEGDLAFHCATNEGKLEALKELTKWTNYDEEMEIKKDLLEEKNDEGDTPLHIALKNKHKIMATHLMNECEEACYVLNEDYESPLYLAIKVGYLELAQKMSLFCKENSHVLGGKSVVHAAIEDKHLEFLKTILKDHKDQIQSLDEGQRPLSYASSQGYLEIVQYLHKEFPSCAYERDEDGSLPIHEAASNGHIKAIQVLNNTMQLLNTKGQNILHLAAQNGKHKVVSYLLKRDDFKQLINKKDKDGNTPLHLAAKHLHPRVVYTLARKRSRQEVWLQAVNKDGLTPLDLAVTYGQGSMDGSLTWAALRYVGAQQSSHPMMHNQDHQTNKKNGSSDHETTPKSEIIKTETCKSSGDPIIKKEIGKRDSKLKEKFTSSNMVVATLVATVTFAAGFTFPGGYNQSGSDIGMSTLGSKWALQTFVIADTGAMYSSVLAVMILIWTQMTNDNDKLVSLSLKVAIPTLRFSLSMMSVAFMMGVSVVLERTQPRLGIAVLGIGSLFLIVLLIFFPIYCPIRRIGFPPLRCLLDLRMRLLMLVFERISLERSQA